MKTTITPEKLRELAFSDSVDREFAWISCCAPAMRYVFEEIDRGEKNLEVANRKLLEIERLVVEMDFNVNGKPLVDCIRTVLEEHRQLWESRDELEAGVLAMAKVLGRAYYGGSR